MDSLGFRNARSGRGFQNVSEPRAVARGSRTQVDLVIRSLPRPVGFLTLNCDDLKFWIDFLLQHAFDGHERTGQRTWATATGALVADA